MKDGFVRVGVITPNVKVADVKYNVQEIIKQVRIAEDKSINLLVFPELCVTAYTCGDLFLQEQLISSSNDGVFQIAKETKNISTIIVVGAPVRYMNSLYNCGIVIYRGNILGIVPKVHIPNYNEFYEARYFSKGIRNAKIPYNGKLVSFGYNQIFTCKNISEFTFGVEICEDLWVVTPPSNRLAQLGSNIIVNLSASDEVVGKAQYRETLIASHSARLVCGYAYSSAGVGESSTDLAFAGHKLIAENGEILCKTEPYGDSFAYTDIDVKKIAFERGRMNTFETIEEKVKVNFFNCPTTHLELLRNYPKNPFVPSGNEMSKRMEEILTIQANGLATRLKAIHIQNVVVGISGGLDSTLALLVIIRAFKILNLDYKGIHAITMPCFGTSNRTYNNAVALADYFKISFKEIRINKAVSQHFIDIDHDENTHDVTYENSQARERTQVLMDYANKVNGLVVGTGDLSELALGWATYNGDHMSMYGVNASIPKTLVRYLVKYEADRLNSPAKEILLDILNTPISPELLPTKDGLIDQKTEDLVGPYELHDFFMYYFLRFGFSPTKIYRIAVKTFKNEFDEQTIKKWLIMFVKRFFYNQYKRSCLPDGVKVGSVSLSPRGDFRMPSDAQVATWLEQINKI